MQPPDEIMLYEEQRPWSGFVVIALVSCATAVAVFAYAMIAQLLFHRPIGERPMPDWVLVIAGAAVIGPALVGLVVTCTARLIIDVRGDGLHVRLAPLHLRPKKIDLDQVVSVKAVTYSPIQQYGGWGIRCTRKGKAYNARGNRGVRLDYADGRHLLLGSQRPEQLAEAIERLRQGGIRPA